MTVHDIDDIKYLSFESLDAFDGITNVFSTRLGGVSDGFYASMNLGFNNGDDIDKVHHNFEIIASKVLHISADRIVCSKQTHTTNVAQITMQDIGIDGRVANRFQDIDGLMTNVPGIALACFYADCVPLYFYDPDKKAVAVSHSGWRGTVHRMGEETIKQMSLVYGCEPKDIYCAIGPSICRDCYEVSADVAQAFSDEFGNDADKIIADGKETGKYQLDLWKANEIILMQAGILKEHIEVAGLCTCCNSDWLYSHRASNGKRGNLAAFIMINEAY